MFLHLYIFQPLYLTLVIIKRLPCISLKSLDLSITRSNLYAVSSRSWRLAQPDILAWSATTFARETLRRAHMWWISMWLSRCARDARDWPTLLSFQSRADRARRDPRPVISRSLPACYFGRRAVGTSTSKLESVEQLYLPEAPRIHRENKRNPIMDRRYPCYRRFKRFHIIGRKYVTSASGRTRARRRVTSMRIDKFDAVFLVWMPLPAWPTIPIYNENYLFAARPAGRPTGR